LAARQETVIRGAIQLPTDSSRNQVLAAVRTELDAARTLTVDLRRGWDPACIHLLRALSLLGRVSTSAEEPTLPGEEPPAAQDAAPVVLAELDVRQRDELERNLAVVRRHTRRGLQDEDGKEREVESSVRVVHDLLELTLLEKRRALMPRRLQRRWAARVGWVAVAVLLVAAALAIRHGGWSIGWSSRARPSRHAAVGTSGPIEVSLAELAVPKVQGTPWDAPGTVPIPPAAGALVVRLGRRSTAAEIEISLDNNDRYRIDFMNGAAAVGSLIVGPTPEPGGLIIYREQVPAAAVERGFDAIRITPLEGDGAYSVGHLTLSAGVAGGAGSGEVSPVKAG